MTIKRVVAMFNVDTEDGAWTKWDVALMLDCWTGRNGEVLSADPDSMVWDSLEDFLSDIKANGGTVP